MENHPNMESFEKFIKQQSDEFRMYPSKRVWYSVYNNFHPGRKWPSISMCILLLSALLMIGFLNTKNNKITIENSSVVQSNKKMLSDETATSNTLLASASIDNATINTSTNNKLTSFNYLNNSSSKEKNIKKSTNGLYELINKTTTPKSLQIISSTNQKITSTVKKINTITANNEEEMKAVSTTSYNNGTLNNNNLYLQISDLSDKNNSTELQKILNNYTIDILHPTLSVGKIFATGFSDEALVSAAKINPGIITTNITDKQWIENYAMYNRPAPRKWKGKLAWQAHFTPSVIYRQLYNNTTDKNISGNAFASSLNNSSINSVVNQTPSIGIEAGLGLQYPIFKGVKLKAGVQFNYTRFNISAFGNSHPSATTLEMNSGNNGQAYELSRSTPYSNITGLNPESLHNRTYQLSLPIGTDIKLAGIDNVEWYAGATIQPTFVFGANSYLISKDRRNYVNENSMLNHFNMNAGFETYISFKTAAGLTWQIGPQFRKQLFSTNSKQFSIEERLMSYGIKIGISKKL